MKVVYGECARRDIASIFDTIAAKNAPAARRVEALIRVKCERLTDFPFTGAATDTPNVFRLPLVRYPYAIFYRVDPNRDIVEIARVIHGARSKNLRRMPRAK
jgi:toxin ParE1/3/4